MLQRGLAYPPSQLATVRFKAVRAEAGSAGGGALTRMPAARMIPMQSSGGSSPAGSSSGSMLSIGSSGSILSIGSSGSILSIGSAGSILSIGSVASLGCLLSVGSVASIGSIFSGFSQWSIRAWRGAHPVPAGQQDLQAR